MNLPEPGFLHRTDTRLRLDLGHDLRDAGAGVRHQEHQPLNHSQPDTEEEHRKGNNRRQQAIEPEIEIDREQRQDEHDA